MSTAPSPDFTPPPRRRLLLLMVIASLVASWIAFTQGRRVANAERRAVAAAGIAPSRALPFDSHALEQASPPSGLSPLLESGRRSSPAGKGGAPDSSDDGAENRGI
jgi:hypothetical protein